MPTLLILDPSSREGIRVLECNCLKEWLTTHIYYILLGSRNKGMHLSILDYSICLCIVEARICVLKKFSILYWGVVAVPAYCHVLYLQ